MPIKISFVGNLGRDANLRDTASGSRVCEFSVATKPRHHKDELAVWMECRVFGDRAEKVHPLLTKGRRVVVWGTFHPREYESKKHGGKRTSFDVFVEEVDVSGGDRGGRADGGGAGGSGSNSAPVSIDEARRILDEPDDSIPF